MNIIKKKTGEKLKVNVKLTDVVVELDVSKFVVNVHKKR